MTPVVMWAKIPFTKTSNSVASSVEKPFVNRNCRCLPRPAHRKRMNNARASTEPDPGLLKPALQWSARLIFDHARRERFWSKGKVVARPNRASDKFDVASKRARRQIEGIVDQEAARRHERALPHIERICEAQSIHKIILVAQEHGFDVGTDYFHMPHGEDQACLVVLCNFAGEFESSSAFNFCVAIEIKSDRGKASLDR